MLFSKSSNGFYDSKIHINNMPSDAVEVKNADYLLLLQAQSEGAQIKADAAGKPIAVLPAAPTLADLKQAKNAEITQNFNAAMSAVVGITPSYEISSWGKQEAEARAFIAAPLSLTPLIDGMVATRGVPKNVLAGKIIAKADVYSSFSGQLIGKRQGLEAAVEAATSKTALGAISW